MSISFKPGRTDRYLLLSFLVGFVPAAFIIHIMAVDFSGFYFQAVSFGKYHGYAYQMLTNYCQNPLNTGLNARAPLVPLLMAGSLTAFGPTLLGIYTPFFLARLCITPLTYLVGRFFLSNRVAFLAALLTVFIPKLQTYSLGAFEADVFVALFYLLALFFYLKSNTGGRWQYLILGGLSLGLGALSKPTGMAIGIGFILAVIAEVGRSIFHKRERLYRALTLVVFFLLLSVPFISWTYLTHHQLYLTTHFDRSLSYIPGNLPSLLITIPLYLTGIDSTLGHRLTPVVGFILLLFFIGLFVTFYKRRFTLTVPTLVTLVLISTLSTCLISGNIPYSFEFVSILGFVMPVSAIILFMGAEHFIHWCGRLVLKRTIPRWVMTVFLLFIMFKFIKNYFTSDYALDYVPTEYYISLPTVIKNREPFHFGEVIFKEENGLRIFKGPIIHWEIRSQFADFRFKPFSPFYRLALLMPVGLGLLIFILDRQKSGTLPV